MKKKLLTLLLAVTMALAVPMTAFADDTSGDTGSTTTTTTTTVTHTYDAYAIFKGTYTVDSSSNVATLSNVTWGMTDVTTQAKITNAVYSACGQTAPSESTASDVLSLLSDTTNFDTSSSPYTSGLTTAQTNLNKLAKTLAKIAVDVPSDGSTDGWTASKSGTIGTADSDMTLSSGYYLLVDVTDTTTLNIDDEQNAVTANAPSLQMVNSKVETAVSKNSTAESYKQVQDINDSDSSHKDNFKNNSNWLDAADYDIGDTITFRIVGRVAEDYDSYDYYQFIFHDKENDTTGGLKFTKVNSVTVYPANTDLSSSTTPATGVTLTENTDYQLISSGSSDKCTFEIKVGAEKTLSDGTTKVRDLKSIANTPVQAGSLIVVEYTSELTSSAVIGNAGNWNEMRLEFSNNAFSNQSGTGFTPWDKVVIFTYKVTVNKVDQKNNPLSGAGFTLYKKYNNNVAGLTKNSDGDYVDTNSNKVTGAYTYTQTNSDGTTSSEKYYVYNGTVYKYVNEIKSTNSETSFGFTGLDDGNYLLVESTTPSGYNTMEPAEFTVTADHSLDSTFKQSLTLNGSAVTGAVNTLTFKESNDTDGELTTTIENRKGNTLPSTGGVGTTIFYVIGGILIVGAGVLLFVKTRTKK